MGIGIMTRSVVREPDQENQSDLPVQKCSVPGETTPIAVDKNMDSSNSGGINGIKTTRYGRTIKFIQDVPLKSGRTLKEPRTTPSPVEPVASADLPENGVTTETEEKPMIKIEQDDDDDDDDDDAPAAIERVPSPEFEPPDAQAGVIKIEENITESGDTGCQWTIGQLAWAQVGKYPYWPCIITPDPDGEIHYKNKQFGKVVRKIIHLQYFGDNGRRGWVIESSLMKFCGLRHFNRLADEALAIARKTSKAYICYVVKNTVKKKWDLAVNEATELLPMSIDERLVAVGVKEVEMKEEPELVVPEEKIESSVVKRKRGRPRLSSISSIAKKPKLDSSTPIRASAERNSIDRDIQTIKLRSKSFPEDKNIHLSSESPPTPPSSHKDSSDEASTVRKYRKRKSNSAADFEYYFKINKNNSELVPKNKSQEEIRKHLKKIWDGMSTYLRNKYRQDTPHRVSSKNKSADAEDDLASQESTPKTRKSKGATKEKDKLDGSADSGKKVKLTNLFKELKPERVCQICEKTGDLTRCKGPCYSYFHLSCVRPGDSESENDTDNDTVETSSTVSEESKKKNTKNDTKDKETTDDNFKCIDCLSGVAPACFICNGREEDRVRCEMSTCGKHFHVKCLRYWPQSNWHGGRLTCPYHLCHTCVSDNPENHHARTANDKLARCVRCPSAYHPSLSCLPAGSEILTGIQVLCPKHYVSPLPPLNAAWCFLCTRGGSLICCDTCPTSFHPECLGIPAPDEAFICEDCEAGRLPLYGEVVWVKLGSYRWWPSRICFPHEVPQNLLSIPHSPGEFCVMFLGTKNYYWVHRGRVFLYQEGDASVKATARKGNVDDLYKKAVDEANEIYHQVKIRKEAKEDDIKNLKPPPYVKLKVNKPVGNVKPIEVDSMVACECDPKWENPCSPDSDCLNRILSIECNPTICPAGEKCNNQSFVRREYPTMEPFYTVGRGWGLKTLDPIKSGQFVIEYVGEVIDEAEYKRRLQRKKELRNENYYFLTIDNCRTIDAEPKGNLSRFMNHSCQPNCETQKWTVNGDTRIGLFAIQEIKPGEELTFNYNLATEGETKKPCLCGASNCSGYIGLKAQKPQLSAIQQNKIDKAEKVKKQRKSKKVKHRCWTCGNVVSGSEEIECGMKSCFKKYHKKCVKNLDTSSKFRCPWHSCLDCDRRTSARCLLCSIAYCQNHLQGKLIEQTDRTGYLCLAHENVMNNALNDESDERESSSGAPLLDVSKEEGLKDAKEESDEDFDTASLLADSDCPVSDEDVYPPRVSIVEVELSSEDSDNVNLEDSDPKESVKEDTKENVEEEDMVNFAKEDMKEDQEDIVPVPVKRKAQLRNKRDSPANHVTKAAGRTLPS